MENPEKTPESSKESLAIIRSMIAKAKGNFRKNAFYFLLWGWVVLAGCLGHYLLLTFSNYSHPELAWAIILIGIIWSIIRGYRDNTNQSTAHSYPGNIYGIVWATFLVNYLILLFFLEQINYMITPIILLLAASSTFISGSLMHYRPLQYGAVAIWLAGIGGFLLSLQAQLLVTAGAILLGYLIPGYMLKNSKKELA